MGQQKSAGKFEIKKFLLTGLGGSRLHTSRGCTRRSRQDACRESSRTGARDFIVVPGWDDLGFPGEGQIGQFQPKKN